MTAPAVPATHVALLRGINVGTARRVPMADLRAAIESLGCTGVRTLLNSGNVVFRATGAAGRRDLAGRIERAVRARTGVSSRVTVITAAEWAAIARLHPHAAGGRSPSQLMVFVLADAKDRASLAPLARRDWSPDALALGPRVAYLWCQTGILDSPPARELARLLGERVTSRNWATVLKLAALAAPPAPGSPRRAPASAR